jgi:hypothetical protein
MKSKHLHLPSISCMCPHPFEECQTTLATSYFTGATHASLYLNPNISPTAHNGLSLDRFAVQVLIENLQRILVGMPQPEADE